MSSIGNKLGEALDYLEANHFYQVKDFRDKAWGENGDKYVLEQVNQLYEGNAYDEKMYMMRYHSYVWRTNRNDYLNLIDRRFGNKIKMYGVFSGVTLFILLLSMYIISVFQGVIVTIFFWLSFSLAVVAFLSSGFVIFFYDSERARKLIDRVFHAKKS